MRLRRPRAARNGGRHAAAVEECAKKGHAAGLAEGRGKPQAGERRIQDMREEDSCARFADEARRCRVHVRYEQDYFLFYGGRAHRFP